MFPRVRLASKHYATHVVIAAATFLYSFRAVLRSGFVTDDVYNSQVSALISFRHMSIFEFIREQTHQWINQEGRFFPVSTAEGSILFNTVHSRAIYKAIQFGYLGLMVVLLGLFVGLFTRSKWAGLATGLLIIPMLQIRHWYDGIIGFGTLLPSVSTKLLAAWILVVLGLRAQRGVHVAVLLSLAAVIWALALMQYEIVFLVAPLTAFIALNERTTWRRRIEACAAIATPTLIVGLIVVHFRIGVTPSPAYTSRLDSAFVLPALVHQLIGPLPMSVAAFKGAGSPGIGGSLRSLDVRDILVLGAYLFGALVVLRRASRIELRTGLYLALMGLGMYVLPGIPTATSVRWQGQLDWGLAYLPAIMQALGLAMVAAAIPAIAKRLVRSIPSEEPRNWASIAMLAATAVMFAVSVGVTKHTNDDSVDRFQGYRDQKEVVDEALSDPSRLGLTGAEYFIVPSLKTLIWINEQYFAWRTGTYVPMSADVPPGAHPCPTSDPAAPAHWCTIGDGPIDVLDAVALSDGLIVLISAPFVGPGPDGGQILIDASATRVLARSPVSGCGPDTGASHRSGWFLTTCQGPAVDERTLVAGLG